MRTPTAFIVFLHVVQRSLLSRKCFFFLKSLHFRPNFLLRAHRPCEPSGEEKIPSLLSYSCGISRKLWSFPQVLDDIVPHFFFFFSLVIKIEDGCQQSALSKHHPWTGKLENGLRNKELLRKKFSNCGSHWRFKGQHQSSQFPYGWGRTFCGVDDGSWSHLKVDKAPVAIFLVRRKIKHQGKNEAKVYTMR